MDNETGQRERLEKLTEEMLDTLIASQKELSFTDPSKADDAVTLGIIIARWASWSGDAIQQVSFAAFEDANFATFSARFDDLWDEYQRELKR